MKLLKNHVPGLRVGKIGLEKAFENDLIGSNGFKDLRLMLMAKELTKLILKKEKKVKT